MKKLLIILIAPLLLGGVGSLAFTIVELGSTSDIGDPVFVAKIQPGGASDPEMFLTTESIAGTATGEVAWNEVGTANSFSLYDNPADALFFDVNSSQVVRDLLSEFSLIKIYLVHNNPSLPGSALLDGMTLNGSSLPSLEVFKSDPSGIPVGYEILADSQGEFSTLDLDGLITWKSDLGFPHFNDDFEVYIEGYNVPTEEERPSLEEIKSSIITKSWLEKPLARGIIAQIFHMVCKNYDGLIYQLQVSEDLVNWENYDDPFVGDGGEDIEIACPSEGGQRWFYRFDVEWQEP